MDAVILAGGQGTRLRPFTLVLPKPLMPVGGMPVLEMTLKWLRRGGVKRSFVTIGYLGHLIQAACGDGTQWGMNIEYSLEDEPLGTIGPLRLLGPDKLTDTFLTLNGDLVTDLDLHAFRKFHREQGCLVTVAVTTRKIKADLGVLEVADGRMTGFREKPVMEYKASMGIYCMETGVLDLVPPGVPFGFDDLMHAMLAEDLPVAVYDHAGLWMDIGRPDDFEKAQQMVQDNPGAFLGV